MATITFAEISRSLKVKRSKTVFWGHFSMKNRSLNVSKQQDEWILTEMVSDCDRNCDSGEWPPRGLHCNVTCDGSCTSYSCCCCCCCCCCNTWQWQISGRISSETTHATALKLGTSIVDISTRFYFASLAALDSPLGHHGPPKSKMGPLSSFTSICNPEASLNRRAPKLDRNVHLHRLSEISNVFFPNSASCPRRVT